MRMTSHGFSGSAGTALLVVTLLACSVLIAAPAGAVTKYPAGAPSFSAAVTGVNEFTPGEDATISILLKNSGLNTVKQVDRGTITPEDLPNTAKFTTVSLASSGDAVLIRSDPQMIGDIPGSGSAVTVLVKAKISTNATEGVYLLPLTIRYKYAQVENQETADIFVFTYTDAEETLPLTLRIKPLVKTEVTDVIPDELSVGSQGYLNLKIRNAGPENGTMAVVKLLRNGQSPVIPSDSSVFVGNFPSGDIVACTYKVSIAKDATEQTYPVDVMVTYTNREGAIVSSAITTVGVPVLAKAAFAIPSPLPEIPAGTSRTVEIPYRNDGPVIVYNAQARITPHDPVTITDNDAYLGDLKPGETVNARYDILVAVDAEPKMYSFDSSIRYRDARGNSLESDTLPVQVTVAPAVPGGFSALAVGVIAVIVICIGYVVYRKKRESH